MKYGINRITITFHMLMGQHLGWLLVLLLLLDMQSIPVFQMVRHVCIPLSDSSTTLCDEMNFPRRSNTRDVTSLVTTTHLFLLVMWWRWTDTGTSWSIIIFFHWLWMYYIITKQTLLHVMDQIHPLRNAMMNYRVLGEELGYSLGKSLAEN